MDSNPGWNKWYKQSNGEWSSQLINKKGQVLCLRFRSVDGPQDGTVDRFEDLKGKRLAYSPQVETLEDGIKLSTPRTFSEVPALGLPRNTDKQTLVTVATRESNFNYVSSSTSVRRLAPNKAIEAAPLPENEVADNKTLRNTGKLPTWYKVQNGYWFQVGRVFRVWLPEPDTSIPDNDGKTYGAIRPWVVIKPKSASAICIYGGQGIAKSGLTEEERKQHAILFAKDSKPMLVQGEGPFEHLLLPAFKVNVTNNSSLMRASRLRFDAPRTIQYNNKVFSVGMIVEEQFERLIEYYTSACIG